MWLYHCIGLGGSPGMESRSISEGKPVAAIDCVIASMAALTVPFKVGSKLAISSFGKMNSELASEEVFE